MTASARGPRHPSRARVGALTARVLIDPSADVWVAKGGGYPVSMSVQAAGGSENFEMSFDITDINNPSNKVESPV